MPVLVYWGEEAYDLQEAMERLRKERLSGEMAAFNHKVLKNPSIADILEATQSAGLLFGGDQQLVEIHQFKCLTKAASDDEAKLLEQLKEALQDVGDAKTVVFVSPKIDRKLKFPKWLTSQPWVQAKEFELL